MTTRRWAIHAAGLCGLALLTAGCHTDMWRQPKSVSQEPSGFFSDGMTNRLPVEGTIPYGELKADDQRFKGREGRTLSTRLPQTLVIGGKRMDTTRDLEAILQRGRERFMIFCSHCHGALGDGKGMIAQRGLQLRRPPATYHTDRLRGMPIGHFYDVMTNGYGVMYPMKSKISTDDRWAIAAYIRVLQRARNVPAETLTPEQREALKNPAPTGHAQPGGAHGAH